MSPSCEDTWHDVLVARFPSPKHIPIYLLGMDWVEFLGRGVLIVGKCQVFDSFTVVEVDFTALLRYQSTL